VLQDSGAAVCEFFCTAGLSLQNQEGLFFNIFKFRSTKRILLNEGCMQFRKWTFILSLIVCVFLSSTAFALSWEDFSYTVSGSDNITK
jgi:hypothetical protein